MKEVRFNMEDVREISIRGEGDTYVTKYVRATDVEHKNLFIQLLEDSQEQICPHCGMGLDQKDHSQCEEEYVSEESLIAVIEELQVECKDPHNSPLIFTINGRSFKII